MTLPEQRSFFSLSGFPHPFLAACPRVTDRRTERRVSHGFYSPFMMLDLCPLLSSQLLHSDARLGVREGTKEGKRGGQRCLMGQKAATGKREQLAAETAAA